MGTCFTANKSNLWLLISTTASPGVMIREVTHPAGTCTSSGFNTSINSNTSATIDSYISATNLNAIAEAATDTRAHEGAGSGIRLESSDPPSTRTECSRATACKCSHE